VPKTVILQVNTASHITMDTRHGVGISRPPRLCCLCVSLNRLFMIVPDACSPQGNGLRNERPISAGNRRRTRRMQHEDSIGCITGIPEKWCCYSGPFSTCREGDPKRESRPGNPRRLKAKVELWLRHDPVGPFARLMMSPVHSCSLWTSLNF
jgi:hypothetical protein